MSSPVLVRVHRWVALGLGVVVLLLTLAGASLLYRDELTAFFTPEIAIAPRAAPPDAWQRVLTSARSQVPEARSIEIVPARREDRAWEVVLHGVRAGRHLLVDPHDGRVVADSDRQSMPFVTLYRLHTTLFLGPNGEYLAAIGGLALLFMAVSGIVLMPPPLRRVLALRPHRR